MFNEALNIVTTEGQFAARKRRLQTMTIHQHDNGRFYVTDDQNGDRTYTSGHATVVDAEKAAKWMDESRIKVW